MLYCRLQMTAFDTTLQSALEEWAPGSRLLWSKRLVGGMSAKMTSFEVELPNGTRQKLIARQPSRFSVQRNCRVAYEEFEFLQALSALGLPAPKPQFMAGGDSPFFVVDYIEGACDINPADPAIYLERYADQLAAIHAVDLSVLEFASLAKQDQGYGPHRENPAEELRETEIRNALSSIGPITRSNNPVLRHGDFWPGNVLWRDREIAGVIDWEEALVGEPLADLAICRLDLWWVFGEAGSDAFTRLYQARVDLDYTDLPYWDLCASLRPITNIDQWAPSYPDLGRPDITAATLRRDHQLFVGRALANFRSTYGARV